MDAWKYQKILQNKKEVPTPNDIYIAARKITNLRNRCLFILLYLTAGRISEVVGTLYRKDINEQFINNRRIIMIRMFNRKNPHRKFKDIPVPYDKESLLLDELLNFIKDKDMEEALFPFSRTRGYQIIKKEAGFNPHWLRHLRLSHLVIYQNFSDQILVKFSGWSDSRPSKNYMDLRVSDILQYY